ncbi:hypothetical protein, partial [Flavobacterium bizetiae]|uniref:hypothetical protein n=1 Tax=Flavobacterium bizetiae TaxID=2704140 RepID=UPI0037576E47
RLRRWYCSYVGEYVVAFLLRILIIYLMRIFLFYSTFELFNRKGRNDFFILFMDQFGRLRGNLVWYLTAKGAMFFIYIITLAINKVRKAVRLYIVI